MPRPRSRKLRQSSHTFPAVHSIHRGPAKPKRSASFTYLQVQAQIVHVIPFEASFPPSGPRLFSKPSRPAQVARNASALRERSIGAVGQQQAFVRGCSVLPMLSAVVYLGKIDSNLHLFHMSHGMRMLSRSAPANWLLLRPGAFLESVIFIALDKPTVNRYLLQTTLSRISPKRGRLRE